MHPTGYYVGKRLLATGRVPREACHSHAYFCSTCGDVWGRVVAGPVWQVHVVPCIKHIPQGVPDWSAIPGTFTYRSRLRMTDLSVMDWAIALEFLPEPVLDWELEHSFLYHDKVRLP